MTGRVSLAGKEVGSEALQGSGEKVATVAPPAIGAPLSTPILVSSLAPHGRQTRAEALTSLGVKTSTVGKPS